MTQSLNLIATCAFGLEALVVRELESLGFEGKVVRSGRIGFSGTQEAVALTNVHLRVADRVLVEVAEIDASDFDALFEGVKALPWENWIDVDAEFPVNGRSIKSKLTSVPAVQRSAKKAIVERLLKAYHPHSLPETGSKVSIEVALLNDRASLTLDTTGPSLHKRGYRTSIGGAPLKETLAAALVQLSFWRPGRPLLDPFCGTGTIPIEAAMIGRGIAPGMRRSFAAEKWTKDGGAQIDPAFWHSVREEAKRAVKPPLEERLIGTDWDPRALGMARLHARNAGVEEDIHFQDRAFADLRSPKNYGCLITNPPYGERLGETLEIKELYQSMPHVLRQLKTWSHFIITSQNQFERLIGQEANRRRKLYNGRIQCTYYQFHGPRPPLSRPQTPSELDQAEPPRETNHENESPKPDIDIEIGIEKVPQSLPPSAIDGEESPIPQAVESDPNQVELEAPPVEATHEAQSASPVTAPAPSSTPSSTPSLRDKSTAKIPKTPVQVEPKVSRDSPHQAVFGGLSSRDQETASHFRNRLHKRARHLRRWPKQKGITCYRLYERDIPEVPLVVDRYGEALHISEFERPHERSLAEHADWLDLMVREAADVLSISPEKVFVKFRHRQRGLDQYQKNAGVNALQVVEEGGLRFLVNLSDYVDTGLFLDHRITRSMVREECREKRFLNLFAYTGSFTTYAVDGFARSTTTVDLSNTYLEWSEKNLTLNDLQGPEHRFIRDDAMSFLRWAREEGERYEVAVIDPPTHSNSKKTQVDWDVQEQHVELLQSLSPLMVPGGVVFFSTNFRRFKPDEAAFDGFEGKEISRQTIPEDFRNKRIHRCWRLVKTA